MKRVLLIVEILILFVISVFALSACNIFSTPTNHITKATLTSDMITINNQNGYVYTGKPIEMGESDITIVVNGSRVSLDNFTMEYTNNVNVGFGTVKVTAKDNCPQLKGSAEKQFEIVPAQIDVYDTEQLVDCLMSPNYDFVTLKANYIVPSGVTMEVRRDCTLVVDMSVVLQIDGELVINGQLIASLNSTIINTGKVKNDGKISISSTAKFYNLASSSGNGQFENKGKLYCNSDNLIESSGSGEVVVRRPLEEAEILLQYSTVDYVKGMSEYLPGKITVIATNGKELSGSRYDPKYFNNNYIGNATVLLTADAFDEYYYGSKSITYQIVPGIAKVSTAQQLVDAFQDKEYNRVQLTNDLVLNVDQIVVPGGYTLLTDVFDIKQQYGISSTLKVVGQLEGNIFVDNLIVEGKCELYNAEVKNISNYGLMTFSGNEKLVKVSESLISIGTVVNRSKLLYKGDSAMQLESIDNSSGIVYTRQPLQNVENVVLQHDISSPDVMWLTKSSVSYNGSAQKPSLRVAYGTLSYAHCYINYYREQNVSTSDFTNYGVITVKVSIAYDALCDYYGSAVLQYEIERSSITVYNSEDLKKALSNVNYYEVLLGQDITTDNYTWLTIKQDVVFDLNDYTLDCYSLTNDGTLIVTQSDSFDSDAILTDADCRLRAKEIVNNGILNNWSVIVIIPLDSAKFVNNSNATLNNNGSIYTNATDNLVQTDGTGTIYGRRFLSEFQFSLEYSQVDYDSTAKQPQVSVHDLSNQTTVQIPSLNISYVNNINAGKAMVNIGVNQPSQYSAYYGSMTCSFDILRGTVSVDEVYKLENALLDSNWQTINVVSDIYYAGKEIKLNENTALNVYEYELYLDDGLIPTIPSTSQINVEASTLDRINKYKYVATHIKLSGDVGDNTQTLELDAPNSDINLTIDLNSHNINCVVVVGKYQYNNNNVLTVNLVDNSEEKLGCITGISGDGDNQTGYSLSTGGQKYVNLTLDGITVYGFKMDGSSAETLNIVAHNCTFYSIDDAKYHALWTGSYNIPLNATIQDCTIQAGFAVQLQGWEEKLQFTRCTITATGEYKQSSLYRNAGSGYAVNVHFSRVTNPIFEDCTISSQYGYGIIQTQSKNKQYSVQSYKISVIGGTITGAQGNYYQYSSGSIVFESAN